MNRHPIRRWALRAFLGAATLAALGVAVIGFAHTEPGRPLLRYIPGMGACPLDAPLTAADRTRVRQQVLAPLAGEHPAASRKVLTFELGRTTRADVTAWAAAHAIACQPGRKLALRCLSVPSSALDQVTAFDEVSFDFGPDDQLTTLDGSSSLDDAALAADFVATRDRTLRDQLGAPTTVRGEANAETVNVGPLSQISREFRFSDVHTRVIATNSSRGKFAVREFHQLIAG